MTNGATTPQRFAWPRAAAHWLLAVLIAFMLASGVFGLARTADADPAKVAILRAHIIAGLGVFLVLALYLITALTTRRPAKATSGAAVLDALAAVVHATLPFVVLAMVLSGVATVWLAQLGPIVFAGASDRLPGSVQRLLSHEVHEWTARGLLALVGLHVIGALYHQIWLRDGLLDRMAIWGRRRKK